jgi:hypothetical protein
MVRVLDKFSDLLNSEVKMVVGKIVSLFDNFVEAPNLSGKAWESLFLIVLLIRLVTRQFDPLFLP